MSKRPKELDEKLAEISNSSDEKIIDALEKIESSEHKGKLKATITAVAKIAGVHPNTVRNRPWVKSRLKVIKNRRKQLIDSNSDNSKLPNKPAVEEMLRDRIRALLEQNAILYQEILGVNSEMKRKDNEISVLKRRLNIKNKLK